MSRLSFLLLWLAACAASAAADIPAAPAPAPMPILIFGDSLSAGYGIAVRQSWPALLQERLRREKFPHTVVNASISGETTAGGKSRLPAALRQYQPKIVILALGANDGLRGLPIAATRENLAIMARTAKAAGARVLLVGMQLPPNYGPDYTRAFSTLYREIARAESIPLLPFLLEPIAPDSTAFQADRLHPTADAQPKILDHIWPTLRPLLKEATTD